MVEIEGYNLPDELYYTKDHTWARIEGNGMVTVGMDAFGTKAAGNIEFIDLPLEDDVFESGDAFGSLESAKWVGGLLMPVGGTVTEVNENIEEGWLKTSFTAMMWGRGLRKRSKPGRKNDYQSSFS